MKDDPNLETINITLDNPTYTLKKIVISNFPIEYVSDISGEYCIELHKYQYYLHKLYDHISIGNYNFIITNAAQKSISLLCTGVNVINIESENRIIPE